MNYKKLFIVGCGRSGTTWIHSIFLQHPCVVSFNGETMVYLSIMSQFLPINYNLTFMETIRKINLQTIKFFFNTKIKKEGVWEQVIKGQNQFKKDILMPSTTKEELLAFIKKANFKEGLSEIERAKLVIDMIFDDIFIRNGGNKDKLFVEKSPSHTIYAEMILKGYPEAKIIEVVRDGRDACVSMEKLKKEWFPAERKKQIRYWKQSVELGIKLKSDKSFSGRILLVRYEDLKENPEKEIKKMFDFAGIDSSYTLVSKIAKSTDFSNYKDVGNGKLRRKGIVGDWKNHFTEKDKKLFNKIAGDLMIKLGYKL